MGICVIYSFIRRWRRNVQEVILWASLQGGFESCVNPDAR